MHVVYVSTFFKKEKETSNTNLVHMTKKCRKNAIETAEELILVPIRAILKNLISSFFFYCYSNCNSRSKMENTMDLS